MNKKIVYIDMDGVLVDFKKGVERFKKLGSPDHFDWMVAGAKGEVSDIEGIFSHFPPMAGALDAFAELSEKFEVFILSTAPWNNPSAWTDKRLWVEDHIGEGGHKRLILSHHKHLCAGDFLIDDRTTHGVDKFKGEHIHFGSEAFPGWSSVLEYLRTV